jgi:ketosteroid isomerase-like protein
VSQENVELIKALVSGAGDMDKQTVLAALPELIAQTCAPDIEWVEDPSRADGAIYRGHEGVRQSWERWLEQWDEWEGEVERFIDCGDHVLVVASERGSGAASGASVSARNYMAFTIREGKIVRYQEFYDEQSARKAVGLED